MEVEKLDLPRRIKQDFLSEGIEELNPPQQQAVNAGLMEGKDMVVAAPTASGKTLIAEMAMTKQVVENEKKTVYIVPLKALASEKYQDFSERFKNQDVRMAVGDYDDEGVGFETADIIVVTSEKLDSMLRHNPSWIHEIGLVVVDEIHLLTSPERGPTLEVTLSRLRDLLDFQMLGLSATISNSDELADWLDAELVESSYRPVELKHGILEGNEVEFYPEDIEAEHLNESSSETNSNSSFQTGTEVKENGEQEIESETYFVEDYHGRGTLNLIEDTLEKDKQAIIFCSSRKGAEKSSDRAGKITEDDLSREERKELEDYADRVENVLGSPTSQCKRLAENIRKGAAFHHAGLLPEQRSLVEEAFRKGLIRTVSATPTLAAGVNLPAFRVIIRDLKRYTGRGMEYIPVLEYEQMTGRAGRPKYDDRGEAISIASGDKDEILERFIIGEPERIQSKLNAEPTLRMHTLSLVASRFCTSMSDLKEFYKETFYAFQFQNPKISEKSSGQEDLDSSSGMREVEDKIEEVVEQLKDYGFLEGNLDATKTGKRVSELYIDPDSANHLIETLEKAGGNETNPVTYLFMLSRTSEMTPRLRVKDKEYSDIGQALMDAREYILEDVPEEWEPRYDHFLECMKTSLMMRGWMSELEEERLMEKYGIAPGGIRAKMQNADWLLYASKELARMKEIDVEKDLEKVRLRLKHGIKDELLPLVKYDQIGRVRARKLHDHGVRSQEDIRETSFEKLKKLIGKRTAEKLKKQVGQENIFDRENIMDYFD